MPSVTRDRGLKLLLLIAAFIIFCAGLKAASSIIVPVLAAIFVSIISIPPLQFLRRIGFPGWLAGTVVFTTVVLIVIIAGAFATRYATQVNLELPTYQREIAERVDNLIENLRNRGITIFEPHEAALEETAGEEAHDSKTETWIEQQLDPSKLIGVFGSLLASLTALLRNTFFVLLTVFFILTEASTIPDKIRVASNDPDADMGRFSRVYHDIQVYLAVKTQMSAATGICAGFGLWLIGVPYWPLLAFITFLLNFIPALGSIIAAIPAVLITWAAVGFNWAIVVLLLYLAINTLFGSILEPKIMGRRVGLSALVVFLSLVFWGWLLGIVGMFLAVPLTMLVKIILDRSDDLRWVGILLGSGAPSGEAAQARRDLDQSRNITTP
jgi:predicted PurR-regulated permease PerM